MDRSRYTRWAAPVAFLAAVTIGALVVRAGFEHGRHHHAQPASTTVTSTTKKKTHAHGHHHRVHSYTIESGDTLASIAAKTGTTVAELEHLNPGIDPTALRVGQTIRVQ
ncbi:MAG TPA: LysM domain-containing protein [Gaiellaceae bacterium]